MASQRDQLNSSDVDAFIHPIGDKPQDSDKIEKPTCGDLTTTYYVDNDGVLSLEGGDVTEWVESDVTVTDLLGGDGR